MFNKSLTMQPETMDKRKKTTPPSDSQKSALITLKLQDNTTLKVPRSLLATSSLFNDLKEEQIINIQQFYLNMPWEVFAVWFTWYELNKNSSSDA